jgi:hypothetical protein
MKEKDKDAEMHFPRAVAGCRMTHIVKIREKKTGNNT